MKHTRITSTRTFFCSCYMFQSLSETIRSPHVDTAVVRSSGSPSYTVGALLICTTGVKCGVKWGKFRGIYCVVSTHFSVYSTVFPAPQPFKVISKVNT
jgi:hypothetical protein